LINPRAVVDAMHADSGEVSVICDVCGASDVQAFKCKLICLNCGTILRTCSDLAVDNLRSR
jgi:hypothetical protein